MPDERKPPGDVSLPDLEHDEQSAQVHIAAPADSGTVDLGKELAGELAAVQLPDNVDPHVKAALDKLRAGTQEGLSSSDHYNLGVAYMGMGLVDDAVREFNAAKKPARSKAKAKRKPRKRAKVTAKPKAKKRAPPKKKAHRKKAKRAPAKKRRR